MANWGLLVGIYSRVKELWGRARIAAWISFPLALSALVVARSESNWLSVLIGNYVWLLSMVALLIGVEIVRSCGVLAYGSESWKEREDKDHSTLVYAFSILWFLLGVLLATGVTFLAWWIYLHMIDRSPVMMRTELGATIREYDRKVNATYWTRSIV